MYLIMAYNNWLFYDTDKYPDVEKADPVWTEVEGMLFETINPLIQTQLLQKCFQTRCPQREKRIYNLLKGNL